MNDHRLYTYFFGGFILILLIIYFGIWNWGDTSSSIKSWVDGVFAERLIVQQEYRLADDFFADAIYILGGSQTSQEYKYKTVAQILKRGQGKHVWILSNKQKTQFNPELGRNMTTNEWSKLYLKKVGVNPEAVDTIVMRGKFFGTLTEAEHVSHLAREKGFGKLILVTAPYHSRRTLLSFSHFAKNADIDLKLQISDENASVIQYVVEYFKLKVYQVIIIGCDLWDRGETWFFSLIGREYAGSLNKTKTLQ